MINLFALCSCVVGAVSTSVIAVRCGEWFARVLCLLCVLGVVLNSLCLLGVIR